MTADNHPAPIPRRGVGAQAILLAGSTGIAQVVTALLYVLAARSGSPSDLGHVVAAIALGTSLVGFADFGTNGLWVRELARGRSNRALMASRLYSKLLIAGILASLLGVFSWLLFPDTTYWMAAPVGFALLANQTMQVPLRGMARAELVSFSILADRMIAGVVMAVAISVGAQAYSSLWLALTIGSLGAAAMGWFLTPKGLRLRPRIALRLNPWKDAGYYGLSTLAISAQSLDLTILAFAGGPTAAGLYGAVNRWTQPIGLLVSAFSSASAPFVARSSTWHDAWQHVKKGIWLLGIAIIGCLVIAIFAPAIVGIVIGDAYQDSAIVLRILALSVIPAIANQPLSVFLQSMGYDRPVAFVTMGTVILQLIAVAITSPLYGATGAAAGVGVVQVIILICLSLILRKALLQRDLVKGF
jgi:O-antigen/teichoic acid export membrane protein